MKKALIILLCIALSLIAREKKKRFKYVYEVKTKAGKILKPSKVDLSTIFEDSYQNISITFDMFYHVDESEAWEEHPKESLEYILINSDTLRFQENKDSRIDVSKPISRTNLIPKDGGYRSVTELVYNSPSYQSKKIQFEERYERLLHQTALLTVHSEMQKVYGFPDSTITSLIKGYSRKGKLYWGKRDKMYPVNMHHTFPWIEYKVQVVFNEGLTVNDSQLSGSMKTFNLPAYKTKEVLHILDLQNRKEILLNKRSLSKLLKQYDEEIFKQYKKARRKRDHVTIKEYFFKLLAYLNKQEK